MINVLENINKLTPIKKYTLLIGIISLVLIILVFFFFNSQFNKFILIFGSMWLFYLVIFMSLNISDEYRFYLL